MKPDSDPATANALLGTDTAQPSSLQYFNGTTWLAYSSTVTLPSSGQLLVRLGVSDDAAYEGPETYELVATRQDGFSVMGTATIVDDGTGAIFPDNATGNPDPDALRDDDRPLQIGNITVNENSPYAVFTVTGQPGQSLTLALTSGSAQLGTDTGAGLEVFNGSNWVAYNGTASLPVSGTLLVRVAVNDDSTFEGPETFSLSAVRSGIEGTVTGTATIVDDGTGQIYPANNTGTPDPNADRDDDRALQVNNLRVNEDSPFAVFTVTGTVGQTLTLGLRNDADPLTANAMLGTDTAAGSALQYFNGSNWVNYAGPVQMPEAGQLLVRLALRDDQPYEGEETFELVAQRSTDGLQAVSRAVIVDDGTGAIYPNNTTGSPDASALRDDDRTVQVNSIEVNENSPYAVFTVEGAAGQVLALGLQNDSDPATANAWLGTDTQPGSLQVFNGSAWVPYSGNVTLPAGGVLLVRVGVLDDTVYEGPETFQLTATLVGGSTVYGTATVLDDGRGAIYPDNRTGNPDLSGLKDDDRPIRVNSIEVNENSPHAVFTVQATPGQTLSLALQNDADPLTADAMLGTDTLVGSLEYFNGQSWVAYSGQAQVPANGELLVRVAVRDDTVYEGAERFQLAVTNTGASTVYGTATLLDDGTGQVYAPGSLGTVDPQAVRDDDRPLQVSNLTVNENSPYAVFTVTGTAGQTLTLGLQNDSNPSTADATLGADTLSGSLQYFDGSRWVGYNGSVTLPASGPLLVKVALQDDTAFEGPETLQLVASRSSDGFSAYGTATIVDDGTGAVYPDNLTGNPDPAAVLDDDRPLQVNAVLVNEGSPYAVLTVTATPGQLLLLTPQADSDPATTDLQYGVDTVAQSLQVYNGSAWVNYSADGVYVPASGQLLVRLSIRDDAVDEGAEVGLLKVTRASDGVTSYGRITILDDGTGAIYPAASLGQPDAAALRNDDRPVQVNSIRVNENSPYAVFTVSGAPAQTLSLALQNDSDTGLADARIGTDVGTTLEIFDGSTWRTYTGSVTLPAGGTVLVRVPVLDDTVYEGIETVQLRAQPSGNAPTAYGTAEIVDDGSGAVYPGEDARPDVAAVLDDDRIVPDNTPPKIAISSDRTTLGTAETALIRFRLSEASSDFTLGDVQVSGGTLSDFQGSGQDYTAVFTPRLGALSGSVKVASGRFTDAAGNANQDGDEADNTLRLDMATTRYAGAPTLEVLADDPSLVAGQTTTLRFQLSEPSLDFDLSDITVVGGKLSNFQGGGTSYSATFTPTACSPTAAVLVASGAFSNAQGVFNEDGFEANNAVSLYTVQPDSSTAPPTIALSSDKSTLLTGQSVKVTFALSHNSSDFTVEDVTVIGGTLSDFAGEGGLYTATITPEDGVTSALVYVDSHKFQSAAGNRNVDGAESNNVISWLVGSHGCSEVFDVNLSDVQAVTPTACLGQRILKIEGDANDVVNLSDLLDNGQDTGDWKQLGQVVVDHQSYRMWTHSGDPSAVLLIDTQIMMIQTGG